MKIAKTATDNKRLLAQKITSTLAQAKGQFERMAITFKYVHDLNINREEREFNDKTK